MSESLLTFFTSNKGIKKCLLPIGLRIWFKDQIIINRGIKDGFTKWTEVADRGERGYKLANFSFIKDSIDELYYEQII